MTSTIKRSYSKTIILTLCTIVILGLAALKDFQATAPYPTGDEARYIQAALNLSRHGVLSRDAHSDIPPEPSLIFGGPLIAHEIAIAIRFDPSLYDQLYCHLTQATKSDCPEYDLGLLRHIHTAEIVIFIFLSIIIGTLILGKYQYGLLTGAILFGSSELFEHSGRVLTEPLFLATSSAMLAMALVIFKNPKTILFIPFGVIAAIAIANKPILSYVAFIFMIAIIARLFAKGSIKKAPIVATLFFVSLFATLSPFYIHSYNCCGILSLSDPNLLTAALSHRFAYNDMSITEWFVAWIFYLPDFGDSLSAAIFDKALYLKLGWNPESYYVYGRDVLHSKSLEIAANLGVTPNSWLIDNYVMTQPLTYLMVSLPLAWRGILISKYFAYVSLICVPWMLRKAKGQMLKAYLFILVPLILLALGQSLISVSIGRYNLLLSLPYAVGIAFCAIGVWNHLKDKWQPKSSVR